MRVDGMHPWWDEEEEKRRAAAIKTRPKGSAVNTGKGSQSFDTLGDYDDAIGKLDGHIEYLNGQQYEAMMQGHQTKMNALTPMIKKAERDKAILENERSNVMGLGENGWDSKSLLGSKLYTGEPLSTDIGRFTPEQRRKMDVLVGEHLPVNPNHLTPEQRSKADVYVGENSVAGQYVPRNAGGADGDQYVDDMTQTFNGMSAGLKAAQANTRESILDSLSPELRSKADIYVGEVNAPDISDENTIASEQENDDESSTERESRVDELKQAISEGPKSYEEYLSLSDYEKFEFNQLMQELKMIDPLNFENFIYHAGETISAPKPMMGQGSINIDGNEVPIVNWSPYNDRSYEQVGEVITIRDNDFDVWEAIANFNMKKGIGAVGSITSGVNSILETANHIEIGVKLVEDVDGEKKAVITYYDDRIDPVKIFGVGHSNMTKEQRNSDVSTFHLLQGNSYYIDGKHMDQKETGYLYVNEDGNIVCQPVSFAGDKVTIRGRDITSEFFQPFVLPEENADFICAMLESHGLSIDILQKE